MGLNVVKSPPTTGLTPCCVLPPTEHPPTNQDKDDEDDDAPRGPMTTLPAYDESVARYLAEMNAAAYACGSYEGCGQWACTSCLRHPNTEVLRFASDATSTSGFVGYDPDEGRIVLAYAGTQPGDIEAW